MFPLREIRNIYAKLGTILCGKEQKIFYSSDSGTFLAKTGTKNSQIVKLGTFMPNWEQFYAEKEQKIFILLIQERFWPKKEQKILKS